MLNKENSLGFALTTTLNTLRKKFNKEIKKYNLTSEQFAILKLIETSPLTPTELSEILKRDKANITRIISSLEKKKYIKKIKKNNKSYIIHITSLGNKSLKKAQKYAIELQNKIKNLVTPKEYECLIKTLSKIRDNF